MTGLDCLQESKFTQPLAASELGSRVSLPCWSPTLWLCLVPLQNQCYCWRLSIETHDNNVGGHFTFEYKSNLKGNKLLEIILKKSFFTKYVNSLQINVTTVYWGDTESTARFFVLNP